MRGSLMVVLMWLCLLWPLRDFSACCALKCLFWILQQTPWVLRVSALLCVLLFLQKANPEFEEFPDLLYYLDLLCPSLLQLPHIPAPTSPPRLDHRWCCLPSVMRLGPAFQVDQSFRAVPVDSSSLGCCKTKLYRDLWIMRISFLSITQNFSSRYFGILTSTEH